MVVESNEAIYSTSREEVRSSFGVDRARALAYYGPMLGFIRDVRPPSTEGPRTSLLDVGCGTGWGTLAFGEAGYEADGIDLNPDAFEAPPGQHHRHRHGSATAIPFDDATFDVVVAYQCLEHVPDPVRALDEMARVCKPGGVVCVVGPNLVTPIHGLAYLARPSSWRGLRFRRHPGMARHPSGNTVPEILGVSLLRSWQMVAKALGSRPSFLMRVPDKAPPFHADNDACYLCNPTDLLADFRRRGFAILRRGRAGRPPLSYLVAGGTWVAARKPV